MANQLLAQLVEPQPTCVEPSARWSWPLRPPFDNDGKSPFVYTASREWWEYVPDGAKPSPLCWAEQLSDSKWYWVRAADEPTPVVAKQWLQDYFANLRFEQAHHLGLGDIRLTIGQQEEIIERLTADEPRAVALLREVYAKRQETLDIGLCYRIGQYLNHATEETNDG